MCCSNEYPSSLDIGTGRLLLCDLLSDTCSSSCGSSSMLPAIDSSCSDDKSKFWSISRSSSSPLSSSLTSSTTAALASPSTICPILSSCSPTGIISAPSSCAPSCSDSSSISSTI